MGLPRMFGGGVVRQANAIYVFNGGIKRTVRGIQVRDGGTYRRIYDMFAPVTAPTNISHFVDPTPSGSPAMYRVQATFANPPNDSLNHPDPGIADRWSWRVMLKSPRFSGGTIFVAQSFRDQLFGNTTDLSNYLALAGDQVYIEVYLKRTSNGLLGPVATTSSTFVP